MRKLFKNNVEFFSRSKKIQIVCDSCEYVARDREDVESIQSEGVCTECSIIFKHQAIDDWKKGIRPTRDVARSRMNIFIEEV